MTTVRRRVEPTTVRERFKIPSRLSRDAFQNDNAFMNNILRRHRAVSCGVGICRAYVVKDL
jgi:hypothetical protein